MMIHPGRSACRWAALTATIAVMTARAFTAEAAGSSTVPDDDTVWRAMVDEQCAVWLPVLAQPDPTIDPLSQQTYVQTLVDTRSSIPSVATIPLPPGPGRTPADLESADAAAGDALERAAAGAAVGDLDVTLQETTTFFSATSACSPRRLLPAGRVRGPADASVAATAALNVSILSPWQVETGFDSVWVSQSHIPTIARIDPDDGALLATIPMPSRPIRAQPADGRMVVRTETDYVVIDAATNAVVASLPYAAVGPNAGSSWAVDGALWICDGTRLHRYDPVTLTAITVVEIGIECVQPLATEDVVVAKTYNPDPGDSGNARAVLIDPATNAVTSTIDLAADAGSPVVLEDRIFFPPALGSLATVVDRATGTVVATPDLGRFIDGGSQAAFDGTSIYIIADKPTGTIVVVDPATYAVTGEIKAIATAPRSTRWPQPTASCGPQRQWRTAPAL